MNHSSESITLAEVPYADTSNGHEEAETRIATPTDADNKGTTGFTEADLVDQTLYLPPAKVRLIVASLALSFFLAVLEQTILATALPSIASTFNAGSISSWVVTSFLLGSTATSPFFGRFADIFGRKPMILVCTAIFFFSTLGCAFCSSISQLIAFRAFQGAGASGVNVLSFIVLSDVVPLTDRGKYQGIVETIVVVAQTTGPLLSGVLVECLNWRACFWTLLPLIAITGFFQWLLLPAKQTSGGWRAKLLSVDYLGCALMLSATVLILVPVSRGGAEVTWTSAETLVLLVLGTVLFIAFGFWEACGARLPLIPIRLFKLPTVLGVHLATVSSMAGQFIIMYYMPSFLQVVRGLSTIVSGAVMLPYGALLSTTVYVSVVSSRRVGTRILVIMGHAIWTAAFGIFTTFGSSTSVGKIVGVLIFAAIGGGLCVITSMMALEAGVPRADRAIVTSSRNFARLLGASLGMAVAGSLVTNDLTHRLEGIHLPPSVIETIIDDPDSIQQRFRMEMEPAVFRAVIDNYVETFRVVFWVVTGLMLFAFIGAACLVRSHSLKRDDDDEQKEAAKSWLAEQKAGKGKTTSQTLHADAEDV